MAYPNELYTVFSFLGFLMCLIPLPCHLKGRLVSFLSSSRKLIAWPVSSEHRHLSVHFLGRYRMPYLLHKLNRLEWKCNKPSPDLVWILLAFESPSYYLYSDLLTLEIGTRFILASSLGIPASSLCISRRLYIVQLGASRNEIGFNKNHFVTIDLIIGLCLPLLWIPICMSFPSCLDNSY